MMSVRLGIVFTLGFFSLFSFNQNDKSIVCNDSASRTVASTGSKTCSGSSIESHAEEIKESLDGNMQVVRAMNPSNPFHFNNEGSNNCPNPIQRSFNYTNGKLVPAAVNDSEVFATYIGIDPSTRDKAIIRDHGNNNVQMIFTLCLTGDSSVDNLLQQGTPSVASSITADLNVPNKAQCPGRINSGDIIFGYTSNTQYGSLPIVSRFQPTQECL
ncbi:MAG: hypothetical protein ACJAT2_002057 [Bacteriovoracaceae bacterium]|jgi:hypothetical protein